MVACPRCKLMLVDTGLSGQLVACPGCREQFRMPGPLVPIVEPPPLPIDRRPPSLPEFPVVFVRPRRESRTAAGHPGIPAVLSFFYPGLGQIYNGHMATGIMMILLLPVLAAAGVFAAFALSWSALAFGGLYFCLWVWAIVDAYNGAGRRGW